jgi:23S rRNA pseudouridine1911/1915/1917 synthase
MEVVIDLTQEDRERPGVRLDSFVLQKLTEHQITISRTQVYKLIRNGAITLNDQPFKPSAPVSKAIALKNPLIKVIIPNDFLTVEPQKTFPEGSVQAESIPLEILYEDPHIIVLNKPKGMTVHGAPQTNTRNTGTLVNALLAYTQDQLQTGANLSTGFDEGFRPGIVHRIDRQTSGILVVAKNDQAHAHLKEQFENHTVKRKYMCLTNGIIQQSNGKIASVIGRHPTVRTRQAVLKDLSEYPMEEYNQLASEVKGKLALSIWKKLDSLVLPEHENQFPLTLSKGVGLIEFELYTGVTHQIRTQMQHMATPLLFDPLYRISTRKKTQLHLPVTQTPQEEYLLANLDWNEMNFFASDDDCNESDPIKRIGQVLHASSLSFIHPVSNTRLTLSAPLPSYFRNVLSLLRSFKK